jgi:hypothetical protein
VQIIDVIMILLASAALILGSLSVWKIRNLKTEFVEQHKERFDQLVNSIGEINSLGEAKLRAPMIVQIMKRYDVTALVVPLRCGGEVSFNLKNPNDGINYPI